MSFGQRLALKRKQKGLSQQQLADSFGTGKSAISRYERDEISPSIEVAAKLAKLLEASLDELVFGFVPDFSKIGLDDGFLQVATLSEDDQKHILAVIDAFVTKTKIQELLKS